LFNLVKAACLLDTIKRKEIVKILLAPISIKPFQLSDVPTKNTNSAEHAPRQVSPDFEGLNKIYGRFVCAVKCTKNA
jgi:hypothetical protein